MTGAQFLKWRQAQDPVYEKEETRGKHIDHMSQDEAAEKFGVSTQTIRNWETEATPIPKAVELVIDG